MADEPEADDLDAQAIADEVTKEIGDASPDAGNGKGGDAEHTPSPLAPATTRETDGGEETKLIEVAGRKYKTPDEVYRAHDYAIRYNSKLEAEIKKYKDDIASLKPLIAMKERLSKEPAYREALFNAEKTYEQARGAGQSVNQAAKTAGLDQLPPEVKEAVKEVQRLKEREAQLTASQEVQRYQAEDAAFKAKHPDLAKEKLQKVYDRMHEYGRKYNLEMSHEDALFEVDRESFLASQRAQGDELKRVKADADVGSGSGAPVKPQKKNPNALSDDDFLNQEILAPLDKEGFFQSK